MPGYKNTADRQAAPKRRNVKIAPPEHPWDRQQSEPGRAWEAFVLYRDMGPGERTLAKVAKVLGKNPFNCDRWSTDWHWVERAHARDAWLDKEMQKAELAEIQAMRKRHIGLSLSLQGTAATALQKILKAEQAPMRDAAGNVVMGTDGKPLLGPLTLKPSEVRDLAELGMKIERLNRGEPEVITEQHHTLTADEKREGLRQAAMVPELRWKLRELLDTVKPK